MGCTDNEGTYHGDYLAYPSIPGGHFVGNQISMKFDEKSELPDSISYSPSGGPRLEDALNLGTSKTLCEWIYEYEKGLDYFNTNYRNGNNYLFFQVSFTGISTKI